MKGGGVYNGLEARETLACWHVTVAVRTEGADNRLLESKRSQMYQQGQPQSMSIHSTTQRRD